MGEKLTQAQKAEKYEQMQRTNKERQLRYRDSLKAHGLKARVAHVTDADLEAVLKAFKVDNFQSLINHVISVSIKTPPVAIQAMIQAAAQAAAQATPQATPQAAAQATPQVAPLTMEQLMDSLTPNKSLTQTQI
jgi:hypothetical protein